VNIAYAAPSEQDPSRVEGGGATPCGQWSRCGESRQDRAHANHKKTRKITVMATSMPMTSFRFQAFLNIGEVRNRQSTQSTHEDAAPASGRCRVSDLRPAKVSAFHPTLTAVPDRAALPKGKPPEAA
jgi:hypothetical protein